MSGTTTQATMTFPGGNRTGRAVSLVPWQANSLLLPLWPSRAAFSYTPTVSGLSAVTVPQVTGAYRGFVGGVSDGAGNAWLVGYTGAVTFMPASGAPSTFALPSGASGEVFVGAAFRSGEPYFGASSGNLYTNSAGAIVEVAGSFAERTSDIASDGTKLYGVLPDSANLGVLTFANATSGTVTKVATPIAVPAIVAASPSGVAIGGWTSSKLGSGANSLVAGLSGIAATANTTTGQIQLLTGTDPQWTTAQTISGTAHPVDLAWSPNGTQLLATDTTDGKVQVFTLTAGALVSGTTLTVTGAASIAMTPTTGTALVTQTSQNLVSILTSSANVWTASGTVSGVASPSDLITLSDTEAAVCTVSGVTWLHFQNNAWSIEQVVSGLAFTPVSLTTDGNGTIYAAGSAGASGHVAVVTKGGIGPQALWTGSGVSVFYRQGQVAVADAVTSQIRVYGQIGAALVAGGITAAPPGISFIGQTGISIWLCGTSTVWQMRFTAPYTLVPYVNGQVSIYNGTSFSTASLGVEHQPSALVWGPSGVWVATIQDDMFVISPSGATLVHQTVLPQPPQQAGTPLGMSALQFLDGGLFAVSSMNNGLISLVPAQASGAPVAPGNLVLTVASIASTSIGLSWTVTGTPPFNFQAYYRVGAAGAFTPYGAPVTASSIVVSGLSGTTTYNFAVSGTNSVGGTTSNTVSAQTQVAITAPVLSGAPVSGSILGVLTENLAWTVPAGALPINYQVYYRDTALSPTFTPFGGLISQNSLPIGNLLQLHTYAFQVEAVNAVSGAFSNIWTETMPTAPSVPLLTVTSTGLTTATATWTASTGSLSYYQLQYRTSSKNQFANYGPQTTSLTMAVSGLSSAVAYQFQLLAVGVGGTNASFIVGITGAAVGPGQVTATLSNLTSNSAQLNFVVSGGTAPIFFQAGISQGNSGTYSLFGSPASGISSITVTGLIGSSPYGFEIIATNAQGSSTSPSVSGNTGLAAGVSGSQTSVSSPSGYAPTFVGPTGLVVAPGMSIAVPGVRIVADASGSAGVTFVANFGEFAVLSVTQSGTVISGFGGFENAGGIVWGGDGTNTATNNATLATLTYTAPVSGLASDTIQIAAFEDYTTAPTLAPFINIAVSIVSGATSGTVGTGYGVYHSTGGGVSGNALLLPAGYLATSGNQIVDPNNGNLPVRIFGASYAGMEFGNALNNEADPSAPLFGTWQVNYKTIMNAVVAMGINAIRWDFADACLEGNAPTSTDGSNFTINTTLNPDLAGLTVLEVIDKVVAYCGTIGLKIWFGRMWQNGTVGQTQLPYGTPSGIGSLTDWTRANVIADMVMLATRYANNPTVIGIEVNNEVFSPPVTFGDGSVDTDLRQFWSDAGNAILNANPNLLILCQSYLTTNTSQGGVIADLTGVANFPLTLNVPNRLVYTIHTYPPSNGGSTQNPSTWNPDWGYVYSEGIAPVLISEFGHLGSDTSTATQQWEAGLIAYCTTGASGAIAGIPPNGYPPSLTWFCLNASGPSQGDGSPTDNAGNCLLSSADWQTPLPGQLAGLPAVMFYPLG